ncbi:hypothetical protein BDR05DRAFT_943785 [Suillus weaverae]|nr:hypothetical protein BDR05DRAFT_943785 [Suillus weaverae]
MADDKPSRLLDPNNRAIVIQNNHIGEGVTININSSNSYGSTVTKLEHVTDQPAEPTSLPCPSLARPLAPADHGHESVVFNGNTFGEHVVINIASPNSTGAGSTAHSTAIWIIYNVLGWFSGFIIGGGSEHFFE